MPNHFTMLWSKDYCQFVSRLNAVGEPLQYIWGGYNLGSDFNHYNVKPEDYIYLIARMKVSDCVSLTTFRNLFPVQSQQEYHSCSSQILLVTEGTPIRLDRALPVSMVEKLTFQSSKGDRKPKYVEVGRVLNISSFQGIYRLASNSVEDFEYIIES